MRSIYMGKEAYYFKHYNNARNDRKIQRARMQLGIEAYGLYFMTLEVLREQKDYRYPLADIDILANEFGTSVQKLEVIITGYGLFQIDKEKMFFSQALFDGLKSWIQLKELNSLKGKASAKSKKRKAEEQLLALSQIDSTQPQLNSGGITVQQREEKINIKDIDKYSTQNNTKIGNFLKFVSLIRENFINVAFLDSSKEICADLVFMRDVELMVSKNGLLYDKKTGIDFSTEQANLIWHWLYTYQNKIIDVKA